jgi:hypothetical protein
MHLDRFKDLVKAAARKGSKLIAAAEAAPAAGQAARLARVS